MKRLNKDKLKVFVFFFLTHLHQEERDAVRPQGPSQLHVLHFGFNLCHFTTVFVLLWMTLHIN